MTDDAARASEATLVCVGGPKDGDRVAVAAGAKYVEFGSRVPMPDDGLVYWSWEVAQMTYRAITYETFSLAVSADQVFQILVPVGTKPAEALENLIAGYHRRGGQELTNPEMLDGQI